MKASLSTGSGLNVATSTLYACSMIATAILMEHCWITSSGGYKLPISKSQSDTISARVLADKRKISSEIVETPAQIVPSATPGKM